VRPGTWSLLIDGESHLVDVDHRKTGTVVTVGGSETTMQVQDARRKRLAEAVHRDPGAGSGEVIRAPIAGKVIKILVAPGAAVAAGQGVCVVEAMKMENEIKAGQSGKVATVHVQPGQSVESQEPLLTLA
jgi:biotin carboxyl carrier protein